MTQYKIEWNIDGNCWIVFARFPDCWMSIQEFDKYSSAEVFISKLEAMDG